MTCAGAEVIIIIILFQIYPNPRSAVLTMSHVRLLVNKQQKLVSQPKTMAWLTWHSGGRRRRRIPVGRASKSGLFIKGRSPKSFPQQLFRRRRRKTSSNICHSTCGVFWPSSSTKTITTVGFPVIVSHRIDSNVSPFDSGFKRSNCLSK